MLQCHLHNIQRGELQALEGSTSVLTEHIGGIVLAVKFGARYLQGALFNEINNFLQKWKFGLSYLQKYRFRYLARGGLFLLKWNKT